MERVSIREGAPFRVNGVAVQCSDCVHYETRLYDEPCKYCWRAIYHSDADIFEDVAFHPRNEEWFSTLKSLVKRYERRLSADAEACGVSVDELCKQIENRRAPEICLSRV